MQWFRHWAIMRGLPEPVGLSRALLLPTLSQQPANICRGEPTVQPPNCTHWKQLAKSLILLNIYCAFSYFNKSRSEGGWRLEPWQDYRHPQNDVTASCLETKIRIWASDRHTDTGDQRKWMGHFQPWLLSANRSFSAFCLSCSSPLP